MFLLSSAKEHWDHTHDAREAMIGGVAHSGRVIFAAGASLNAAATAGLPAHHECRSPGT